MVSGQRMVQIAFTRAFTILGGSLLYGSLKRSSSREHNLHHSLMHDMVLFFRFIAQSTFYLAERIVEIPEAMAHWMIASFKKPEYVCQGQCIKCGQCCRAIGMAFPRWWLKMPWLVQLTKKWHVLRYNFRFVESQGNMLVYECLYQKSDGTCGFRRWRPALCRNFPREVLFGRPKLHEGCGYFFVKRGTGRFEEVLRRKQGK